MLHNRLTEITPVSVATKYAFAIRKVVREALHIICEHFGRKLTICDLDCCV